MTIRTGGASSDHSQPTAMPSSDTVDSTLIAGIRSGFTTTCDRGGCHGYGMGNTG
jgi:hypothetical protein